MYKHLCEHFAHVIGLHRLPNINVLTTEINNKQHFANAISSKCCEVTATGLELRTT